MKKVLILSLFVSAVFLNLTAQYTMGDSLLANLSTAKTDDERQDILMELFDLYENHSVDSNLVYSNKVLELGRNTNNLLIEARALDELGYVYYRLDNRQKSLDITLESLKMAEQTGNQRLIGYIYVGIASVQDKLSSIGYLKKSIGYLKETNGYKELCIALNDITRNYLDIEQADSALIYATWSYSLMQQYNYYIYAGYTLGALGIIQLKLGNPSKALEYFNISASEAKRLNSDPLLYLANTSYLQYYQLNEKNDSVFFYARELFNLAQRGPVRWMITPTKILYEKYKLYGKSDSALKYHELYKWAQDSLFSSEKIQKIKAISIQEDLRQKEILVAKEKAKEERMHNIQYAAIAIGIIIFLLLFLLLSQRIIVHERLIMFFGVIGLLIVFEFINLVFHPFLGQLTNHSPFLMLLIMVCIAAILVPAHHQLEKWLIDRLVEKNKKIRIQ